MQDIKRETTNEYDRSYIKSPLDIDSMLEGFMASRSDEIGKSEDDVDLELESYIEKINELAEKNPDKAVKVKEDEPVKLSDTKEFYKLSSVSILPERPKVAEPEELKLTGKKASIANVKEYVQTIFPGLENKVDGDGNKIFVVTMPEKDKSSDVTEDTAEIEKVVKDDGEINQKELARFLKDDIFAVVSGKIRKIRQQKIAGRHPLDEIKDKNKVRELLNKHIASGRRRMMTVSLFFVFLVYLAVTQTTTLPFVEAVSYVHGYRWFMLINAVLFIPVLICAADVFKKCIEQILCVSLGIETAIAFFLIMAEVQTVVAAFNRNDGYFTYLSLAAMVLIAYIYFDTETYKKLRADYKLLAFKPTKTCGSIIGDKELVKEIARDSQSAANVRKYEKMNTDDFFTKTSKRTAESKILSALSIISIIFSVALFAFNLAMSGNIVSSMTMLVIALSLTVTVDLCVTNRLPYLSFSKRLKFSGATITGEHTAKAFAKAETLVLGDEDLFPPKTLSLCGSKLYNDADMRELVINVTSVLTAVSSPLTAMMLEIIAGQTELLRKSDSVNYYDEKGISAYVNNNKILIGNRAFMRDNLIKIPADGTQEKIESSGKVPLFVAVNGFLAAIFSIKYTENQIIKKRIKKLVAAGVGFALKSRDPNLTRALVCQKYDIPESMMRILSVTLAEKESQYNDGENTPDVITITKDVSAFFRAHTTAHKMSSAITINTVICFAAYAIGAIIAAAICGMSMIPAAKPVLITILQLLWMIPSLITTTSLNRTI